MLNNVFFTGTISDIRKGTTRGNAKWIELELCQPGYDQDKVTTVTVKAFNGKAEEIDKSKAIRKGAVVTVQGSLSSFTQNIGSSPITTLQVMVYQIQTASGQMVGGYVKKQETPQSTEKPGQVPARPEGGLTV